MDISKAALPPRHGPVLPADTEHPRYGEYRNYRAAMSRLLVEAAGFRDWLAQQKVQEEVEGWQQHPRYGEFVAWMRSTGAGARNDLCFPENFKAWLAGDRW